jgi:hypothetical protein
MLIVCEGEKTEPNYFDDVRRYFHVQREFCIVIGRCGDPRSVVQRAKREKIAAESIDEPFDEIWVVFDRDDVAGVENAIQMARDNDFNVAFSNPCFELWYLLHFRDQTAHLNQQAAKRAMRQCIEGYRESQAGLYEEYFRDRENRAIARAEKLRARYDDELKWSGRNPFTTVDLLVIAIAESYGPAPASPSPCVAEDY